MPDPDLTVPSPVGSLDSHYCAELRLAGKTAEEIAALAGVPVGVVLPVYHSPLTRALMDREVAKRGSWRKDGKFEVEHALASEQENTFAKIVEIRDNAEDEALQLKAAEDLFDRQRPKVTKTEEERVVTFILDPAYAKTAQTIVAETEMIDVVHEPVRRESEEEGV